MFAVARPLWFDEIFTAWAARLPTKDLVEVLRLDSGPPGFYLIEKPFMRLADRFADGDPLLRLPSLLAVLLLFAAARSLPRGTARSAFVILLSCSTLLNLYSGEARPYALLALLCLSLFLLSLRGEQTMRRLLAIAGVTALALWTHYLALFAVGALVLLAARARRRPSCVALLAGTALFAPWLPVLLRQPAQALAWMHEPPGASIMGFLSALGGVGRVPAPFGPPLPPVLFVAGGVVGGLSLVLMLAHARNDSPSKDAVAFVLIVLIGVLAVGLRHPIAFAGRTELAVLPVWLWGLAHAARENRILRATVGVAAGLGLLATCTFVMRSPAPSAPQVVTDAVSRVARTGDIVVASAGFYLPARLAHDRGRLAASVEAMPAGTQTHPGWFVPAMPGPREEELLASSMARIHPGRRLFLIVPPVFQTEGLTRVLTSGDGRARPLMRSRDAFVTLWSRNPASPRPSPSSH